MIQREMHVLECKSVVKVEVFDGLLTAFAKQKKALMIIRGYVQLQILIMNFR
ncbi:pantetheine-phosphate adenylyltransferase domain protein [Anaplasma phagocytophilum str. ApNP]|uniref:Pantetheine-phosphate adenylyltransferase domain protein n=1 Tax=Anaplasma phagocytophilum str. ApNP TaxID=1359153 RepID=A0A0F3NFZ3_ANAPH|nr:pantetheine-phosphate adenylyltransferase domain protein [Anaplasma phagocytophilum str. ApNP]